MNRKKYKKPTSQKRKVSTQKKSSIGWLLCGMLIGVIIPGIFLIKSHTQNNVESNEPTIQEEVQAIKTKSLSKKLSKEAKTKTQHYDFYSLLSEQEGENKVNLESKAASLFLEIGAFADFSKADQLKAQLTLLGMEEVVITKKGKLYKVLAGPYYSKDTVDKIRQQLKDNDINSKIIVLSTP